MTQNAINIRNVILVITIVLNFIKCQQVTNPSDFVNTDPNQFQFIIYDQIDSSAIIGAIEELQNNYARILNNLSIEEIPKITIKIWGNYSHFLSDMESDIGVIYNGAAGYIFSPTEIRLFKNSDINKNMVHEFIHIVSMYVNLTIPNNPRWLWETVALYENNEFINPNNISYLEDGDFPTLNELNSDFNASKKIYEVGFLLGDYIVEKYGREQFIQLIRSNGDIQSTLRISENEFENQWKIFVQNKYL